MAKKRTKKKSVKDIIVIIISIILIVLSISAIIWAVLKYIVRPQKPFEQVGNVDQDSELFNIDDINYGKSKTFLICGVDESEELTDVMMLVSLDIAENKMHILHIPRDSYVGVTTTGKMNSIYNSNYYSDIDPDISNIGRLIRMLNNQFKIGIDYHATITLSAFRDVVDEIGGIPIDLQWTIAYDGNTILYPGEQVLNGKEAEAMMRYRKGYSNADIGRMEARSYFLAAAFNKFKDVGFIEAIEIINKLNTDNPGEFTTNMSIGEMKDYLGIMSNLTSEDVFIHTLPTEIVDTYSDENPRYGQSILSMWKEETAEMLNDYFRPYSDPVDADDLGIYEIVHNEGNGYVEDTYSFDDINKGEATKPRNS